MEIGPGDAHQRQLRGGFSVATDVAVRGLESPAPSSGVAERMAIPSSGGPAGPTRRWRRGLGAGVEQRHHNAQTEHQKRQGTQQGQQPQSQRAAAIDGPVVLFAWELRVGA
jgi:hypothetical protein